MLQWVCRELLHALQYCDCLLSPKGIKKSTKEDWIRIDRGYLDRMNIRKQILDDTPEVCIGNSTLSNYAIREMYEEIILDLLPKRFPTIFRIKGDIFYNQVTGSRHRISTALPDHPAMLRHLAENVEEDFWFMVPNENGEFFLQGFAACFPQGLLPAAKVGLSVREIHAPIPGYEGRLKKGVNRCFERMGRGEFVGRLNVCFPLFSIDTASCSYEIVGNPMQPLHPSSPIRRCQHSQSQGQPIPKCRFRSIIFLFARRASYLDVPSTDRYHYLCCSQLPHPFDRNQERRIRTRAG